MRAYESLAAVLQRQGVEAVFTLISEDCAKFVAELDRLGIMVYSARHEHAAVGMADGYSRASGKLGVAIVGRGPGMTNALTAIVSASKARSRLLVIIGDAVARKSAQSGTMRGPKFLDQPGILSASGVHSVNFRAVDDLVTGFGPLMAETESVACTSVALIGSNLFDAEIDGVLEVPSAEAEESPAALAGDIEDVAMIADILAEGWAARYPVILAGKGAFVAGAKDDLERLADQTGALLTTTLLANGMFNNHPFDIGIMGTFSTDVAAELLARCDLLIAVGSSLNPFTTYSKEIVPKARIIQVDSDQAAFGRYLEPDFAVHAEARCWTQSLVAELDKRGHSATGYRTPQTIELLKRRDERAIRDGGTPGRLDPRAVAAAVNKLLPQDRILVLDPGQHLTFTCPYLSVPSPDAFIFPVDFGSVASGAAVAYGAAAASPDRLTVLCIGDGGLMMSLTDLETAVRYNLRLVVLVSNDAGFGAEMQLLQHVGVPDGVARYPRVDFAAVARALGATGVTISEMSDLEGLGRIVETAQGPVLVDVHVRDDLRPEWADFLWRNRVNQPAHSG